MSTRRSPYAKSFRSAFRGARAAQPLGYASFKTRHPYFVEASHVNVDDALCDAEISQCAFLRAMKSGHRQKELPRRPPCDCRECMDARGRRYSSMPAQHDCDYTTARSKIALAIALRLKHIQDAGAFTREFVALVETEVRKAGLYRQSNNGSAAHKATQNVETDSGAIWAFTGSDQRDTGGFSRDAW